jgi:ActR/RegA family two-component response regulator
MPTTAESQPSEPQREAPRAAVRPAQILIVNDDLEIRLKMAALLRRAEPSADSDGIGTAAYAALGAEALRRYRAVFFFLQFAGSSPAEILLPVARLRDQSPRTLIFVIARGGDERTAVRAVKMGATDYWPAHAIDVRDLAEAIKPAMPASAPSRVRATPRQNDLNIPGYRFIKRISRTDSATVYLAECDQSPAPVALKVQMMGALSAEVRQGFLRECELLSAVNHRAVADVVDFGATADCLYLALEYFPCGSLRDRLRNPLEEVDTFDYARQIGEALRVIHAAGIVHRDLKPSNLMLTDDNRLVMIDFGLAQSLASGAGSAGDAAAADGPPRGTPYYVSPEQIDGIEPDARDDLYSLGVVLFEMLTGTLPFRGNSVAEIVLSHQSSAIPRLPPALHVYQPLIERLLAKNRAERFDSADAFLTALNEAHALFVASSKPQ